jgi:hypothetical protein
MALTATFFSLSVIAFGAVVYWVAASGHGSHRLCAVATDPAGRGVVRPGDAKAAVDRARGKVEHALDASRIGRPPNT